MDKATKGVVLLWKPWSEVEVQLVLGKLFKLSLGDNWGEFLLGWINEKIC